MVFDNEPGGFLIVLLFCISPKESALEHTSVLRLALKLSLLAVYEHALLSLSHLVACNY